MSAWVSVPAISTPMVPKTMRPIQRLASMTLRGSTAMILYMKATRNEAVQFLSMNAAIYCRISEDREGSGLGVERQRQDCQAMAASRGWRVADCYVDNDISAYSGKPRPQYRRLLRDIEEGAIDAVVVWHLDRLHRQPKELEAFIELVERKNVALASVSGQHDLGSPEGRLHARILGAVARMESEHKSRRIRRKKLEMAQQGRALGGGPRPYGFTEDRMSVVEHEADVLREVADRLLAGDSLRSVVLDLNARGDFTTEGKPWIGRSLKRVLLRARNVGLIEHREGTFPAQWPAIFKVEQRTRLQALLNDPTRNRVRGRPVRQLLSGILRCGECGKGLYAGPPARGARTYWCLPPPGGCQKVLVVAGWVDDFISQIALSAMRRAAIASQGSPTPDDRQDLDAIAADRALLDELAAAYANRDISMNEWMVARAPIEGRIEAANRRIADVAHQAALHRLVQDVATLRDAWPALAIEKRRSLILEVIDHVVVKRVGKGSYRDSSRLVPFWKV